MPLIRELVPGETARAWPAIAELRDHLESREEFIDRVDRLQRPQGYRIVGCFEADAVEAAAVAGFRRSSRLAWGEILYVDDLVTAAKSRRRGFASLLIDWLAGEATRLGCAGIHLDSGLGPGREGAHAFYFAHGFRIGSFHFSRPLITAGHG